MNCLVLYVITICTFGRLIRPIEMGVIARCVYLYSPIRKRRTLFRVRVARVCVREFPFHNYSVIIGSLNRRKNNRPGRNSSTNSRCLRVGERYGEFYYYYYYRYISTKRNTVCVCEIRMCTNGGVMFGVCREGRLGETSV